MTAFITCLMWWPAVSAAAAVALCAAITLARGDR